MTWQKMREISLFYGGMAGLAYETVFEHVDRPELLVVFAGMMGLPAFIKRDESRKETFSIGKDDGGEKR